MKYDLSDKKVIIWGTGLDGVKALYLLEENNIEITCFLNTNCKIDNMKSYKVFEPSKEVVKDCFVIVATRYDIYPDIANTLKEWGLIEFDDFVYSEWLNKELVLLHGNCYMEYVKDVLLDSKSFTDKYSLYPNKAVFDNPGGEISHKALENIDVFLHQNISDKNPFSIKLADVYIKQFIRNDCKEIVFPNFVGLVCGMYPQCGERDKRDINEAIRNGEDRNGMFPYADIIASNAIKENDNIEEIIEYCNSDKVLLKKDILQYFDIWIEKIKEREERWDIKILDYILLNYKEQQLFYDMIHPTEILFKEIFDQLFGLLNVEKKSEYIESVFMDGFEMPVYPYVKKVLGLKWTKATIRNGKYAKRLSDKMDLRDYIKEYAWWCFNKKL